jgi:hypothetical protein
VLRTRESTGPQLLVLLVVVVAAVAVAREERSQRHAAEAQAQVIDGMVVKVDIVVRLNSIVQWRALERGGRRLSVRFT